MSTGNIKQIERKTDNLKLIKTLSPEALQCPMRWKEFVTLPQNVRAAYIKGLRERFSVNDQSLAQMFNVSESTMRSHFVKNDIPVGDKKPTHQQVLAWQKFVSESPEVARQLLLCERIVSLRESGKAFSEIGVIVGASRSYTGIIYKVHEAITTEDYDAFGRNLALIGCKNLITGLAARLGKSPDKVYAKAYKAYEARLTDKANTAETNPTVPVIPEEVPDEHISVISPELLKSLNDNLTFFRTLFSGGLKVPAT